MFSEKVFEKSFEDEVSKEAYLKCCKWVAKNIVSKKDELGENYTYRVDKDKEKQLPTFVLTVYATIDMEKIKERHCNICKEMHCAFFINEQYDCNKCSVNGFHKRLDENMKVLRKFLKDKLDIADWETGGE